MADVTGPISTLPGSRRASPEGTMCDEHPDRPAVGRVQGETDSFGSEMLDLCQECLDANRAYYCSEEARTGVCDWCKGQATDLRNTRDYDEGMHGPVYRVCGECHRRVVAEAEEELAGYDDSREDYDFDDDFECWNCGGEGYVADCFDGMCVDADSGCEDCMRRCDVCNPVKRKEPANGTS